MADLPSRLYIYKPIWEWTVLGHLSWRLAAGYVSSDAANPGPIRPHVLLMGHRDFHPRRPCTTLAVVGEHDDRGASDWSPTPASSLAIGQSGRDRLWNPGTHQNCSKASVWLVQLPKISDAEDSVGGGAFSGSSDVLKTHLWAAVWGSPQQLFCPATSSQNQFWACSEHWETFDLPSQGLWS